MIARAVHENRRDATAKTVKIDAARITEDTGVDLRRQRRIGREGIGREIRAMMSQERNAGRRTARSSGDNITNMSLPEEIDETECGHIRGLAAVLHTRIAVLDATAATGVLDDPNHRPGTGIERRGSDGSSTMRLHHLVNRVHFLEKRSALASTSRRPRL